MRILSKYFPQNLTVKLLIRRLTVTMHTFVEPTENCETSAIKFILILYFIIILEWNA